MGLSLVSSPASDPLSIEEVKAHLRVTNNVEDGLIAGYILAARQHIETWTRRALLTQSWRLEIDDSWPEHHDASRGRRRNHRYGGGFTTRWRSRIVLPRPPLQSVDAITYVDLNGASQTLAPDQYQVAKSDTGEWYVEPAHLVRWPLVLPQLATITVDFTAGYGDQPGSIPESLRMGMLLLLGQWIDNRTPIVVGATVAELPNAVEALVGPFRVFY